MTGMKEVEFINLEGVIWEDSRGFSFFPLKGRGANPEQLTQNFHLVSLNPGTTRGNHLHPCQWEWLYPFHGTGLFRWEPRPGDLRESLVTGDRVLIHIPPGIPHALHNPGPKPLYLLAWQEGKAEEGEDTVPYPLD